MNVSAARLTSAHGDFPERIDVGSQDELVAGVIRNERVQVETYAVLPKKSAIWGIGCTETHARISDDLPVVVEWVCLAIVVTGGHP